MNRLAHMKFSTNILPASNGKPSRKEMLRATGRRPSFVIDLPKNTLGAARGFHTGTTSLEERLGGLGIGATDESGKGDAFLALRERVPTPYPKGGASILWGSDSQDGATMMDGEMEVEHDYLPKVWEDTC